MRFSSLKHLAASVSAIAPEAHIVVFGSSSALCTHPNLPEVTNSYEQTLDADFILDPWDESLGNLLSETLGKDSGFFEHYKYYADIVRPAAFDNFPPDFRDRLVPLEGCPRVFALDPHYMAVAKLFAGRPKASGCWLFSWPPTGWIKPRCASCYGTRRWRRNGS
ncbi:DUF6036 family nucleotidyltransferase [Prosthecobacter vanneervenii]|uniref:DUF6036 domain-containing protein n=1 Tax=Prosthecobacter vanneervenii TaxID=48466 RepID=A0A7W7YAI0_9BACT|nr:DUF6036 family nucleotidyltransferase [Prosthecobacter vanneervenii]MBB5032633.1 hypothetical protein [Prosthecobacter vanneervenii]